MYIHLSPEDIRPLYQQIVDQLKAQIMDGIIAPRQELPSIRQLAQQLLTSVITVKRAYEELEREGYIYTRPGLGTFVANISISQLDSMRQQQAKVILAKAIDACMQLGLQPDQIRVLMESLLKEAKNDNRS